MSIRIPTFQLFRMLKSVLAFSANARTDKDLAYLRFAWDGAALEVSTLNVLHGAVATWVPRGEGSGWGGDDDRTHVQISTRDARSMLAANKLPGGLGETPVLLDFRTHDLSVTRPGDEDVPYAVNRYPVHLDEVPYMADRYANPGEILVGGVAAPDKVIAGVGAAAKLFGEHGVWYGHERAGRATVGNADYACIEVFYLYPTESEARGDAEVAVALGAA